MKIKFGSFEIEISQDGLFVVGIVTMIIVLAIVSIFK